MRISDWSSDVCSSDLVQAVFEALELAPGGRAGAAGEGDARREEGVQFGLVGIDRFPGLVDPGLRLRRVRDRLGDVREHLAPGHRGLLPAAGVFQQARLFEVRPPRGGLGGDRAVDCLDRGRAVAAQRMQARQVRVWHCELRVAGRSEEHTSELKSLMRNSYAVFCLKKKNNTIPIL